MKKISPGSSISYSVNNNKISNIICIVKRAVNCFLKNFAPLLYVDATYTGSSAKLVTVSFIDANHHIQPIALSICGDETSVNYSVLFGLLLESGVKNLSHVIIHTDEHKAFDSALEVFNEYNVEVEHIHCVAHILKNAADKLNTASTEHTEQYKAIKKCYYFARRAGKSELCDFWMDLIKEENENVYNYIKQSGADCFFTKLKHPNYLQDTNNPSESLNNILMTKDMFNHVIRSSDLFYMVKGFVSITFKRMIERRKDLNLINRHDIPLYCNYLKKHILLMAYRVEITSFNYDQIDECTVYDKVWNSNFTVDFENHSCECKVYDQTGIPCDHALFILHNREEYWNILHYVDECYKTENVKHSCIKVPKNYEDILNKIDYNLVYSDNTLSDMTICLWEKYSNLKKRMKSKGEDLQAFFEGKRKKKFNQRLNKIRTQLDFEKSMQ